MAKERGIEIGRHVAIDASPLKASSNDPDGAINKHYFRTMGIFKSFSWHNVRCLDTRLPLAFHLSSAKEHEEGFFLPLMSKIRFLGIYPEEVYVDAGYVSSHNIASSKIFWDQNIHTKIPKQWKYNKKINEELLRRRYEKASDSFFIEGYDFSLEDPPMNLLLTLYLSLDSKHYTKLIGQYFRNQMIQEYLEDKSGYKKKYSKRSIIETTHGTEKRSTALIRTNVRGISRNAIQIGLHLVMLHLLANHRLKLGITKGLINTGNIC